MEIIEKEYYKLTNKQFRYKREKELFDKSVAICGIVLLSLIFFGIIALIKIEEGFRTLVFIKQKCVGENQKLFELYKFRTVKIST